MTLWASLALHHAMKYFSIAKRVKYIFLVTNRFDENCFHFVEHYGSFCGLKWRFWWAKIYLAHSQARVIVQTVLLLVFHFFFHALQSGNYSSTVDDAIILVTIIVQFMILWSYDPSNDNCTVYDLRHRYILGCPHAELILTLG